MSNSERKIPLVGFALEAFQACPQGFPRYCDKPDNLTSAVGKFLRENKLLPEPALNSGARLRKREHPAQVEAIFKD